MQKDKQPLSPQRKIFQKWFKLHLQGIETSPKKVQPSLKSLITPKSTKQLQNTQFWKKKVNTFRIDMHTNNQYIFQISRENCQKMITIDKTNYRFGCTYLLGNQPNLHLTNQKNFKSTKKQSTNLKILNDRSIIQNKFFHGNTLIQYNEKNKIKILNLEIIKDLETKDINQKNFYIKYPDLQFIQIFSKINKSQDYVSVYSNIAENVELDKPFQEISGKQFLLIDRDPYYSTKSVHFLFKADEQLDFWRRSSGIGKSQNDTQQNRQLQNQQILRRCQNYNSKQPTLFQMLDFASGKIDSNIILQYIKIKQSHQTEIKIGQGGQNWQEDYKRMKLQYDFAREMKDKNQHLMIKSVAQEVQTIQNLQDQSFDSYFQQCAKDIHFKIIELNTIRDEIIQKKQNKNIKKNMLINIGYQIKKLLFRLLLLILKGQKFINYDQLMGLQDTNLAQRKILQIIYHDFDKMEILEVDGIQKTNLVNIYLEQRQKNQKMFQLLGRLNDKAKKDKNNINFKKIKKNIYYQDNNGNLKK